MELEAGLLSFVLASEGQATELRMWVGLSYCDGDWKRFKLAKRGSLISASVNDWAEETRGEGGPVSLRVDSPLYLGGVPMELVHPSLDSQSHKHGEITWHTEAVLECPAIRRLVSPTVSSKMTFTCS